MQQSRTETDTMGSVEVPIGKYWGAQTQRSMENFHIGWENMPALLIWAMGIQKKAAAMANVRLGLLDARLGKAIIEAADEVIDGSLMDHFPLSVWQTGSGTHTNMNANEVIANRASEILGFSSGAGRPVHPNDHVNMGQSSNDSFSTAMAIAVTRAITEMLLPALSQIHNTLRLLSGAFDGIIKVGRTHLQDAVPITLGQEFSGYARQIDLGIDRLRGCLCRTGEIAQGGTAVGTGLNAASDFAEVFTEIAVALTRLPLKSAKNKFEAIAAHDALVEASGVLSVISVSCMKIANDIQIMASGPRCGLGEIQLPSNEPGSSIMPGKTNPSQCEALLQVCAQVMGNHVTVTIAGSNGQLELNTFKPVIIYNVLQSVQLLSDVLVSFDEKCLSGIKPNHKRINELTTQSLMLVTALVPHIGYDAAARIATKAYREETTLKVAALSLGLISGERFDLLTDPENMFSRLISDPLKLPASLHDL